jgi:trehalose/maltose transport system permease protein
MPNERCRGWAAAAIGSKAMASSDTGGPAGGRQNREDQPLPVGSLADPPRVPKAEIGSRVPATLAQQRARAARLFLTPTLVVLILVAVWPLARTIFFSLTDANLGDMAAWKFIGLTNYVSLAQDPLWRRAIVNTLVFTVISVAIETLFGLIIALTLDAHIPGRGLIRAAVLIPWAIPTVVSAKMWAWMLNDLYGVVNALFLSLGLIPKPIAWLADPFLSMVSVIAVDVWKTTPFMALLILAALQVLPREIYEAVRVDGVSPTKVFFRVTLPLIRPALLVAIIFRGLDALRVFDVVYVLAGNNENTASMSVYARQQLVEFQDVGYGSAAATFLFLIVALATLVVITLGRVNVSASGETR